MGGLLTLVLAGGERVTLDADEARRALRNGHFMGRVIQTCYEPIDEAAWREAVAGNEARVREYVESPEGRREMAAELAFERRYS